MILRLKGLSTAAGLRDIRAFFKSLHIPDGGVWIVGGSLGEAFIAFTSDGDAERAVGYSGKLLRGSKVTLRLSSVGELEHKLKKVMAAKKRKEKTTKSSTAEPPLKRQALSSETAANAVGKIASPPSSTARPVDPRAAKPQASPDGADFPASPVDSLDPNTAFLLGMCTVLRGLQSTQANGNTDAGTIPDVLHTPVDSDMASLDDSGNAYVRLLGLPASTTKEDISQFFGGLSVLEVIVNVKLGLHRVCLVKFASSQDARDALRFNGQSLGLISVEVRGASELMWTGALQECENAFYYDGKRETLHPNTPKEPAKAKEKSLSPQKKPSAVKKFKNRGIHDASTVPTTTEYIVMARNLPTSVTKTELKELFRCPDLAHKNLLHLLDEESNRTDTAFIIFNHREDFEYAVNLDGCHLGSGSIEVSSITRKTMRDIMAENRPRSLGRHSKRNANQKRTFQSGNALEANSDASAKTCLYVRNMPAGVTKNHIFRIFSRFNVYKAGIAVLCDDEGTSIGEAVLRFGTEKLASQAYELNGQDFLGSPLILTQINGKQMDDIVGTNTTDVL